MRRLLFSLALASGLIQAPLADDRDSLPELSPYEVPGRLVDIGTHQLHILCAGQGSPTVVIESGLGGFSVEWIEIQQQLSKRQRVCTYDRGGYGWSEAGPMPRTAFRLAGELELLLDKAGEVGPFILVGHSFGGYIVQEFADRHPDQVHGILLVDASHPQQAKRIPGQDAKIDLHNERYDGRQLHTRNVMTKTRLPAHYPDHYRVVALSLMGTWKAVHAQRSELMNLNRSGHQIQHIRNLGQIPLIVLTRGQSGWNHTEQGRARELEWQHLQQELTTLSQRGTQFIAPRSGHYIHLDQPDWVISAVRNLANDGSCQLPGVSVRNHTPRPVFEC